MRKRVTIFLLILLLTISFSFNIRSQKTNSASQPIWPMYKYNNQRTGRCPYDTTNNMGKLKWKYKSDCKIISHPDPVISSDGTVYFLASEYINIHYLYAINPDGTLKWKYNVETSIHSSPTIGNDGTIYFGANHNDLYAFNPDGTLKWKYKAGGNYKYTTSSVAIGNDGTIYFGSDDNNLYALNPDGTLKWKYKTGDEINSHPAIGNDGTIYFGSDDNNLYALNPDGTLKWKYKTGGRVRRGPVISSNGKIYIISDDDYLHQIELSGDWVWKKRLDIWRTNICSISEISIGSDGTLYFGIQEQNDSYICAFDPELRDYKWKKSLGKYICVETPILSKEDTVYFGTYSGLHNFYAIYPNGNVKWMYQLGDDVSGYAISSDGTIYVTSYDKYLYAFGWYIKLNSPNGGEKLEQGKTYQIKWNTSSTGGYIKIYYSLNSGSTWTKISCFSNNNTNGSYSWTIPSNINTDKGRIKVEYTDSCQDNAKVYESDISDSDFIIKSNSISISSLIYQPNNQNNRFDFQVKWVTSGTITGGKVRISYKLDTFDRWHLVNCVDNTGQYTFSIPFQNLNCAPNFKILLEWVDKCTDPYTLYAKVETEEIHLLPKINLLQPNGGEIFESGNVIPYQIKWNYDGQDNPYVKIYYSLDSGNTFNLINCSQIAQSGSYDWKIPEGLETTKGRIKITYSSSCSSNAFEFCPDMSSKDFIVKPKETQWDFNLKAKGYCGFNYLEWDPVPGAERYWIYRGIGEGNEESMPLTDFPIAENYYKDFKNVIQGTKYCYFVTAVDKNAKEFAKSNEACAIPTCSTETKEEECRLTLQFQIGNTFYWVNGVQKGPMLTAPVLRWDRTFLIIRHVVEEVGGEISWDGTNQIVTILTKEGKKIEFQIGNKMYKVNGVPKQIDPYNPNVVPFILNGRTLIPLRVTGDELNAKEINWYGEKRIAELIFSVPCPEKPKGKIDVYMPENCVKGTYIEIYDLKGNPITIIRDYKEGFFSTDCTLPCPGTYVVKPFNPNCKFFPETQTVEFKEKECCPAYKRVDFKCECQEVKFGRIIVSMPKECLDGTVVHIINTQTNVEVWSGTANKDGVFDTDCKIPCPGIYYIRPENKNCTFYPSEQKVIIEKCCPEIYQVDFKCECAKPMGRIVASFPKECIEGTVVHVYETQNYTEVYTGKPDNNGTFDTGCSLACPGIYVIRPENKNCTFYPSEQKVIIEKCCPEIYQVDFKCECAKPMGRIQVRVPKECTSGTTLNIYDSSGKLVGSFRPTSDGLFDTNCTLPCPGIYTLIPQNSYCKFNPESLKVDLTKCCPDIQTYQFLCECKGRIDVKLPTNCLPAKVEIYDSKGNLIYRLSDTNGNGLFTTDCTLPCPGTYVVKPVGGFGCTFRPESKTVVLSQCCPTPQIIEFECSCIQMGRIIVNITGNCPQDTTVEIYNMNNVKIATLTRTAQGNYDSYCTIPCNQTVRVKPVNPKCKFDPAYRDVFLPCCPQYATVEFRCACTNTNFNNKIISFFKNILMAIINLIRRD